MEPLVLICTYNEAGNIGNLIEQIFTLYPDAGILVVDDFSPDKTYEIVEKYRKKYKNLQLIIRKENRGRGYAGIYGFKNFIESSANYLIEMDGDLSHSPASIAQMIKELSKYDVVIGSRFIPGGSDSERNILRRFVSILARNYIRLILGINVNDPTSGYRAFKKEVIKKIIPFLRSPDPFLVTETLFYCKKFEFKIKEIPISFNKRYSGKSKLKIWTLFKYLLKVFLIKFRKDE